MTVQESGTYYDQESLFHGIMQPVMGTRFNIVFFTSSSVLAHSIWEGLIAELRRMENVLNRFDASSEVALLNMELSVGRMSRVSKEMWEILQLCRNYYEETLGLFDVTLKDFSQVILGNSRQVFSTRSGITFDFGGFGKGYALMRIRTLLKEASIENAFVDFGNSSLLGIGHHPYGDCWKVSLANPYDGRAVDEFELRDSSLSTSGNTPQYEGHIIHPSTGLRNRQRKVCAIVSENPLDAEVLSTVWMIADEEQRNRIGQCFGTIRKMTYLL